ncbi:uncharacterized protein FOMMEDRAFT_153997 [Fomitiporia mediterranea MF3/22]|uniref:uncharacterized protein n=1 Tax=Fomitiporia mediterranea (strain MF3/22) TaxID=694068 RepID=UPI000440888C|nr:uncharacterized protein FOMMEDRAFT_153997 [Fomitiporia mediterranea MF3/22]EJD04864.1 hypothetical protein FOMMEDRAFT_153997 [Fomitiporia mediterranea MF3/22]
MHDRNPYKTPIDFVSLAKIYPKLKPFLLKPSGADVSTIDFKNVEAQRCLTEALLWRDFQVKFSLPEGRLCPPVPNRLNYILWLQDIISESFHAFEKRPEVIGIDIGTGASAIYPLLGCKVDPTWKFIGTEIDPVSHESAIANVEKNGLGNWIRICKLSSPTPILTPFYDYPDECFTFTMCNPPFYADTNDVERSAEGKALEPNSVCTGSEVEMVTPGGEETFVQRMVEESAGTNIRNRCLWFTSMLGKFSSVEKIRNVLRAHDVDNYALTELVQGQTRRWVVAWSFTDLRLPDNLARNLPSPHHALLPPRNNCEQVLRNSGSVDVAELQEDLTNVLMALSGVTVVSDPDDHAEEPTSSSDQDRVRCNKESIYLRISATENTWTRAARRSANSRISQSSGKPVVMIVDISAKHKQLRTGEQWILMGMWRRGRERGLFESFWSHVSRKVGSAVDNRVARSIPL